MLPLSRPRTAPPVTIRRCVIGHRAHLDANTAERAANSWCKLVQQHHGPADIFTLDIEGFDSIDAIVSSSEGVGYTWLFAAFTGLDDHDIAARIFNGKVAPYNDDYFDALALLTLCGIYGVKPRRHMSAAFRSLHWMAGPACSLPAGPAGQARVHPTDPNFLH